MSRFKKGLFLGGLLGAAMMWLNATPKGRKMRDELLDHAALIYADITEKIRSSDAWRDMNKNKYIALVRDAVEMYAAKHGLTPEMKDKIVKLIVSQWKQVQEGLRKRMK